MSVSLKVGNLWRVIRDIDIEAIRRSARGRFELLIVSDDETDARRLHALVSPGGDVTPHPWVVVADVARVMSRETRPAAAILLSKTHELSVALAGARQTLHLDHIPIATIVVGDSTPLVPRGGERARVAVGAIDAGSLGAIGNAVVDTFPPDLRLALAVQLPAFQPAVFDVLIDETARANASFALTMGLAEVVPVLTAPLNLGDMVILTKNQLIMCYRLALAAGRDGHPRRMVAEILGVLGGGLLFRQAARQLVGLIPVVGLVPKVALAYGGTWAIGRGMVMWATEGREMTTESLRRFTREGLARGKQVAEGMLARSRSAQAGHEGDSARPGAGPDVHPVVGAHGRWERLKGYLPALGRRERRSRHGLS
ncbi:MAG: hypothetical protein GEV06_21270 [Luteitalea sp.]|nr:hypothetical protein [Luteitalea sp.]